jgi:hypothetical protein
MNVTLHLATVATVIVAPAVLHAAAKPKNSQPPPQTVTVKDLAIREARACDSNRNGKIDPSEMMAIRTAWTKNPKSYLYLFDSNDNRYLEDAELATIQFKPAPPPAKPGAKPAPKKK